VTPALLLQDHYRWIEYQRGRTQWSLVNNSLWALTSLGLFGMALAHPTFQLTAPTGILLWGLGTMPSVALGVALTRQMPRPRLRNPWLSEHKALTRGLAQDFLLLQASAQGAIVLMAAFATATDIALLRKAQIWLGALTVATSGLMSSLQPVLVRRFQAGGQGATIRPAFSIGSAAAAACLAYGSLVLLLPTALAEKVTGSGWDMSKDYVLPLTVQLGAGIAGGCAGLALRATGQLRRQVRARRLLAPLSIAAVAIATPLGGALWGAWSLAGISVLTAALWTAFLLDRGAASSISRSVTDGSPAR
jgi:hypothetical protein